MFNGWWTRLPQQSLAEHVVNEALELVVDQASHEILCAW
jgi:hypothetical protein